ncbi:MAG: hypothetical protein M3Q44_05040 [bacterium]|nr:hypothetical protein [bacterium]
MNDHPPTTQNPIQTTTVDDLFPGDKEAPKKPGTLLSILLFMLIVGISGAVIFFLAPKKANHDTVEPATTPDTLASAIPTATASSTPIDSSLKQTPNITLKTGFAFNIPKNWAAKISSQTSTYFSGKFIPQGNNSETTYIEIESLAASKINKNPLITFSTTKLEKINELTAEVSDGIEKFGKSQRKVKQAVVKNQSNALVITLFSPATANTAITEFNTFINSISSTQKQANNNIFSITKAHAAESIAGIEMEKYEPIEVMDNPLPERITRANTVYKDGYAKFYIFEAFRGQRLTTVSMEDTDPSTGVFKSFIRTEMYAEDGNLINSADTRIEFDAPYTGKYYYVVRSFENREGGYLVKIFDRNQTENLMYVKYDDGAERLYEPNKSPQYGAKEVALIIQFINPVEVLGTSVRFFATPKEFEAGSGLVTIPVKLYAKEGTYESDITNGTYLPEDDQNNLLKIKITKLSNSKLLIEPETGGLFARNRHYNMQLYLPIPNGALSFGGGRLFTEDPKL